MSLMTEIGRKGKYRVKNSNPNRKNLVILNKNRDQN
jgi:hypothetical protein